jgi:hypothetical protein
VSGLSDAEARLIAAKLIAARRLAAARAGIEVDEGGSAVECAGVVDVQETVIARWRCPRCWVAWEKRSRPVYGALRSCGKCGARYFLRRPAGV